MTVKHYVEIIESDSIGFMDEGFREGWSLSSGSGSFANAGTIAGDYAVMEASGSEVAFSKDIDSLSLSTDDYPILRARLRGEGAGAEYAIIVWYTDSTYTNSGWLSAGTEWLIKNMELASGKTIGTIQLWARGNKVHWDYVAILKHPPLIPEEIEELEVELQTTTGVSGYRLRLLDDPLYESLVLWLKLDEGFGTRAYDQSRHLNHGTIYGASWVEGRYDYALNFDGVDNYIEVPDDASLNMGTKDFTVSLWIKTTQATGIIIEKYSGTLGWQVYLYNGKINVWGKDPSGSFSGSSDSTYNDGNWHFVVVVFDRDSGTYFYKDGNPDGSSTSLVNRPGSLDNANPLRIGRQQSGDYFNGVVDEVRLYNRALTPKEVYGLYVNSPLSGAQRSGVGDSVGV